MPGSHSPDLDLITEAATDAGKIAMRFFRADCAQWEKEEDAGPVSEADLAVNALLMDRLGTARPDYGLLSEEAEDDGTRHRSERTFIIDPIDGTRAFLRGETGFAVAIAIVEQGEVVTSVVHLPARGETYSAELGLGARLNGALIGPSRREDLAGASALGASASYKAEHWPGGLPPIDRIWRHALEWRLCLVAAGDFDLMVTMRDAWEWDVAAGALVASEAGAPITDRDGGRLRFNSASGKVPGVIVSAPALHPQLIEARFGPTAD